jgi:hypothetical protein
MGRSGVWLSEAIFYACHKEHLPDTGRLSLVSPLGITTLGPDCHFRIIVEQTIEWQTSLCMNFIDFEKAFDSIDHQVLWKILKHYGIPQKIISIIQQLYDGFSCQVIHDGNLTEPFTVTTGVRQGCILSPLLFVMVIEWVSKTAYKEPKGIQWTLQTRLEDLDFADDICMLSHRYQMQHQEIAKQTSLLINPQKTKTIRINTTQTDKLTI